MKNAVKSLIILAISCISAAGFSKELAVVTAPQGYLLDESFEPVETVSYLSSFEIVGADDDFLQVLSEDGVHRWIHKQTVHRSSWFDYITDENMADVSRSLELMHGAHDLIYDDAEKALKLAKRSLKKAKAISETPTPGYAWLLSNRVFLHLVQEDYDAARLDVDQALHVLKVCGAESHLQAADVFNIQAALESALGNHQEALDAYHRAASISRDKLGESHVDVGTIMQNLSDEHEQVGDYPQSLLAQREATRIYAAAFPESAYEYAESKYLLGRCLNLNDETQESANIILKVMELFDVYHADSIFSRLNSRLAYDNALQGNSAWALAAANHNGIKALILELPANEVDWYRKDLEYRSGNLDYSLGDLKAAIRHYSAAVDLIDLSAPESDDGLYMETLADVLLETDQIKAASLQYEKTLQVLSALLPEDATESEDTHRIAKRIDSLKDAMQKLAAQSYALVCAPQGYLLKDDGEIDSVPALLILPIISETDEFVVVDHEGIQGRIPVGVIRTGNAVPGFAEIDEGHLPPIFNAVQKGLEKFTNNDFQGAWDLFEIALEECEMRHSKDITLWAYLRINQISIEEKLNGTQAALKSLKELEPIVEKLASRAYPIQTDFDIAAASLLMAAGDFQSAQDRAERARETLQAYLGEDHADVMAVTSLLGTVAFSTGAQADRMLEETAEAVRIAEKIYPPNAPELADAMQTLALSLTVAGKHDDAITILEQLLEQQDSLTPETLLAVRGTLARTLLGQERTDDAMKLFRQIHETWEDSDDQTIRPVLTFSWHRIADHELALENTADARRFLLLAIRGYNEVGEANNFAASEAHMTLARIYLEADEVSDARSHFESVLSIYEELGGADSPQAEEVRKILATMPGGDITTTALDSETRKAYLHLRNEMNGAARPGEQMVVAVRNTRATDGSNTIANINEGTTLWSFRQKDGMHLVFIADKNTRALVSNSDVVSQAEHLTSEVMATAERDHAESPAAMQQIRDAIDLLQKLATNSVHGNALEEVAELEGTLAEIEELLGDEHLLTAELRSRLAEHYTTDGQFEKGLPMLEAAIREQKALLGPAHPQVAANLSLLAAAKAQMGDVDGQRTALQEAVEILGSRLGADDRRVKFMQFALADCFVDRGDFEQPERFYKQVLAKDDLFDIFESQPDIFNGLADMGRSKVLLKQGDALNAMSFAETAVATFDLLGKEGLYPKALASLQAAEAFVKLEAPMMAQENIEIAEKLLAQLGVHDAATMSRIMVVKDSLSAESDAHNKTKTTDAAQDLEASARKAAQKVLETYLTKDLPKLLTLTGNAPLTDEEISQISPSRLNSLFGENSWRWQAVSAWDGKTLPNVFFTTRRSPVPASEAENAHVEFGRRDGEVFVVTLEKDGDSWNFEDIHSPDAAAFEGN